MEKPKEHKGCWVQGLNKLQPTHGFNSKFWQWNKNIIATRQLFLLSKSLRSVWLQSVFLQSKGDKAPSISLELAGFLAWATSRQPRKTKALSVVIPHQFSALTPWFPRGLSAVLSLHCSHIKLWAITGWGNFLAAFLTCNCGSGEEFLKCKKVLGSILKINLFLPPPAVPKSLIATLAPFEAGFNK